MSKQEGIVLSLDLVHERDAFLSMSIRRPDKMLQYADGTPVPITLPEGCIGMMLVFDSEEAAQKHDDKSPTVRLSMKV